STYSTLEPCLKYCARCWKSTLRNRSSPISPQAGRSCLRGSSHPPFFGARQPATPKFFPYAGPFRAKLVPLRQVRADKRGPRELSVSDKVGADDQGMVRNISDTARWAAYFRAQENRRPDALFRDPYAERLAGTRGAAIANTLPEGNKHEWAW